MSEIVLKRGSKFCLRWSFVGLKSVWFCLQWPVFYVRDSIKKGIEVLLAVVICWLKSVWFCLQWPVCYVWDRIKKEIEVLLAVVICWLKVCFVLLAVACIFMSEIELKRWSKFCLQWSFVGLKSVWFVVLLAVASSLFWDGIKKEIEVLLAVVICWLKICLVLLAVASILSEIELKRRSQFSLQWSFVC